MIFMTNKTLTSTEKSILFRKRNKELGRSGMRGTIETKLMTSYISNIN